MAEIRFRPIGTWPGRLRTDAERQHAMWKSGYDATLADLKYEAGLLDVDRIVVRVAVEATDLRQDGMLRARSEPAHPGVIVVLMGDDLPGGRLSLHCDLFKARYWKSTSGWVDNLRAIAKSLEAMRALERWGATQGRQYAGFAELPSGIPLSGPSHMTTDEAAQFIAEQSDYPEGSGLVPSAWESVRDDPKHLAVAYRVAAKRLHPDHGGDVALFQRLQDAKALLDRRHADG